MGVSQVPQAIGKLVHRIRTSQVAGVLGGALVIPISLLAFANYSALEFVGTYFVTLPVAGVLLWLTGQWRPRLPWPRR